MALENSNVENSVVKSEEERIVIAKEVIIKALLPVVFGNVYKQEEREEVFDHWYKKLLKLITGTEEDTKPVKVVDTPPEDLRDSSKKALKEEVNVSDSSVSSKKAPRDKHDNPVENKATEKQIKKIFAMGHALNMSKEELEKEAFKVSGVDKLSELSKSQASALIDGLTALKGIKDIYG